MAERYVRFDVSELMRIAGKAVGREQCTDIVILTERGFNKIFLLTMDDGYEVIARIPTPIAGPSHYTTASEVATMDFLRTRLKIPVPKVFAWASRIDSSNPVGAEYIIMEKMRGETLSSLWKSLSQKQLVEVIKDLVGIEDRILSTSFPSYGSLYYKQDLEGKFQQFRPCDQNAEDLLSANFCIGPIVDRSFWANERGQMTLDRGPWASSAEYLRAIAQREASWTAKLGKPCRRQFFTSFSEQEIAPEEHISLLTEFGHIAPYLLPKVQDLCTPTLRHPDLHQSNIFLCPQTKRIVGVIGWQGASTIPFLLQSGFPALCNHDPRYQQTMVKPKLPEDFDQMSLEEQETKMRKYKHELVSLSYMAATGVKNKRHLRALRVPYAEMRQYLIKQAGIPWDGDLINLRAALVGVYTKWRDLVGEYPCPISISKQEVELAMKESNEWNEAADYLARIRDNIGIDGEGGTDPENYDRACALNREWRLQMLKHVEVEERQRCWQIWPYKDDDEDSGILLKSLK